MRLSEIIGARVVDGNGRNLGVVRDVQASVDVEEGGAWRSVRVEAIVVASPRSPRPGVDRPLVFGWLDRRFDRRARTIPWDRVRSGKDRVVQVQLSS